MAAIVHSNYGSYFCATLRETIDLFSFTPSDETFVFKHYSFLCYVRNEHPDKIADSEAITESCQSATLSRSEMFGKFGKFRAPDV